MADQRGYSQSQVCRIQRRCLKTLNNLGLQLSQRHNHLYRDDIHLLAAAPSRLTRLQGEPPPHARRFGTAMTCLIRPDLVPISLDVPHPASDVLVIHRDWIDHPGAASLLTLLREHLQGLQKQIPALTLPR